MVKRGFSSTNAGDNEGYVNQHGLSRKVRMKYTPAYIY